MDDPAYAFGVFQQHFQRAQAVRPFNKFVGLELGPGDSLSSAVIASAYGASRYLLVDIGPFADTDLGSYRQMTTYLAGQGFNSPPLDGMTTINELLTACRAQYLTQGLESLRTIPESSVDFIWSHGVLQQIRRDEFTPYLRELRRILHPTGACSHLVDLSDLMAFSLNNLRFSEGFWESNVIAHSGYYTNRIRFGEMLSEFQAAGFLATVTHESRWNHLPIDRARLARTFRDLPESDLSVSGFSVLLQAA